MRESAHADGHETLAAGGAKAATLSLRSPVILIPGAYAMVSILWILGSDSILELIAPPEKLVEWSVLKGLAFIVVTAIFLFLLVRRTYGALQVGYNELHAHRDEVRRLNRLNAVLSQINQAIVRTPRREELLKRVCEVLVEHGGFQAAWVGWHEPESGRLVPEAAAGDEGDFFKTIRVYVDERPEGQGPSGRAFREGQPCVCNDVASDPVVLPWRADMLRLGLRSSVALPVRQGDVVCGILNVYSARPGFFQGREMALLVEAADDLAFGLEALTREADRRRAQSSAEAERRFSHRMTESLPGVLYFYDHTGRFLRWNRRFEEASGYPAEEIAHMRPLDFFAIGDKAEVETRIMEVFAKGESSVEARLLSKDGRMTPYFFTGRRIEFDGKPCLVGVGIDITERKQAEAELLRAEAALRELNASLEHKVVARTEELRAALVRAEAADRVKSAFLATMSHELRTPLNSIIGFTGIVLQELAGPLNAEQKKQLGMVRSSARHLLDLINDVQDISKIEAGQLDVRSENFDLRESLERAGETVRPLAEKKGLAFVVRLAPEIGAFVGDRRRTEQVLLNLLQNAVKFSERGGVTLTADRVQADLGGRGPAAAVRLRVSDTGIGIRSEDQGSLFQPFRQIDSGLSRQHEGTGLGLAICRRLVTLMGGEITVKSEWGLGSEFTVTLPLAAEPAPSSS